MKIEKLKDKPKVKIGRPFKYPYLELEINESFTVSRGRSETIAHFRNRIASSLSHTNRKLKPKEFLSSRDGNIITIWREK